jgi:hypothetical protein
LVDLSVYSAGATIVISGSASNDGTYTVVSSTSGSLVVNETLVDEASVLATITGYKISTSGGLSVYPAGATIVISGSTSDPSNDGTYTVSGTPTATEMWVVEPVVNELASTSVTITGYKISTLGGDFTVYADGETVDITGSTSNDGTYTVSGTPTATVMFVVEPVGTEAAGASVTITNLPMCDDVNTSTFPIPIDPQVTAGSDGIIGTLDDIVQVPGVFTLHGGTILSAEYTETAPTPVTGSGTAADPYIFSGTNTRRITVVYRINLEDTDKEGPVLTWGGHIARSREWINANPTGSPYHMRGASWDCAPAGGCGVGQQDLALSSDAVRSADLAMTKSYSQSQVQYYFISIG